MKRERNTEKYNKQVKTLGNDDQQESPLKKGRIANLENISIEAHLCEELARILNDKKQGCCAIRIVNQGFIITDNNIHSGSKASNNKISFIKDVMNYFSLYAQGHITEEARVNFFEQLCLIKARGCFVTEVTIEEKIIRFAAREVVSNPCYQQNTYSIQMNEFINDLSPENQRELKYLINRGS